MGKNQAYKAMQRAKLASSSGGPETVEDGLMDGSFHSPEWHAARLASLRTCHTVTWEEFRRKQKEDELKKSELEADKDRMMKEYRAQLDAERASKLSHGRKHSSSISESKGERGERESKYSRKRKKHSRKRGTDSDSSLSSETGIRDENKKKLTRKKEKRKHKSRSKHSSSDGEGDGPLPLSKFFGIKKSI